MPWQPADRALPGSLQDGAWEATGFRHDPGRYRDEVMAVIERGVAGVLQPTSRPGHRRGVTGQAAPGRGLLGVTRPVW